MKKRLLSLLLVCIMVLGMLPATVLADEPTPAPTPTDEVSTDTGSAQITKKVSENEDGTYKLTMEAYVTGSVQTSAGKPLDIVLVLDQSGSMAGKFDETSTRQAAMKTAVTNFISKVAENSSEHRISIVTFGSTSSPLVGWTQVNTAGKGTLTAAIAGLDDKPEGATQVDYGMTTAVSLLDSADPNHDCVVIVFTDGVPTTSTDFNTRVADSAIRTAKTMKNNAEIYTVGIFSGAYPAQLHGDEFKRIGDGSLDTPCDGEVDSFWGVSDAEQFVSIFTGNEFPDWDVPAGNRFLNYLSSNSTDATEIGIRRLTWLDFFSDLANGDGWKITQNFTCNTNNGYYMAASSAEGLNSIFNSIAESIVPNVSAGTDVVLSDTLTDKFSFVYDGDDVKGLSFAVSDAYGNGEEASWITAEPVSITASVDGKTITFSGFDYSNNAVVKGSNGWQGAKLIVTFDIKPNATGWNQGTHLYDTNDTDNSKAALKPSTGDPIAELDDSPSILLTAYRLTYRFDGDVPAGKNAPTDNNNCYLSGTEATLASTDYSESGYTFDGWYLGEDKVESTTITMDSDKTLVGKWSRDRLTLTYDSTSGSWASAPTGHTAADETPITKVSIALEPREGYTLLSSELPTHADENGTKVLFVGWTNDATNTTKIYGKNESTSLPTLISTVDLEDENITVYAVWGYDTDGNGTPDVQENWYNLYYDANGGTGAPETETDLPVGNHTLSGTKPTHNKVDNNDVFFVGWSLTKVADILSKEDKTTLPKLVTSVYINKDTTVYAVWGYDKNGDNTPDVLQNWITITYNANGGAWNHEVAGYEMNSGKTTASVEVVSPYKLSEYLDDHPAQEGKEFSGWYQDENCTTPVPPFAVTLYQDIILYAGYAEPQTRNVSITVRKHLLNGSEDVTPTEDAAFNLINLSVADTTTYDAIIGQYNSSPITYYGGSYVYDENRTTVNNNAPSSGTVQQGDAIDLYFVLDTSDQSTYTVEFYYDDQIDSERTESFAARVGSSISKYDDALTQLIEKNLITGYKCSGVTPDSLTVDQDASKNVIKVYYVGTYAYSVEYFYDNVQDANATETGSAEYGTVINTYTDKCKTGFELTGKVNLPLTISADASQNVIRIYYSSKSYDYTVYYYKDSFDNAAVVTETGNAAYGADIPYSTAKGSNASDPLYGYKYQKKKGQDTVTENAENNVLHVLYVKDETQVKEAPYTVEYYKDNILTDTDTVKKNIWVNDTTIPVEAGDINTTNKYEGYSFQKTDPSLLPATIAIGGIIKVYYTKDFVAAPSLKVTKEVNKTSAKVGDTLLYTITITNNGNVTVEDIEVSDVLSRDGKALAELELYQVVGKRKVVVETIDKLEPGKSVTLYADYTVKAADAGKTLRNTAVAKAPNVPETPGTSPDTDIDKIRDKVPALNKKDHVAYIIGYEDLTVRPENNITRAEVATIFFRLLEDSSRSYYWSQTNAFSDVNKGDWFNNAVSTMSNAGIITGYPDGTFRPNAPITRAEFSAIAARFSDVIYNGKSSFSDVAITFWAYDEITLSEHLGWITGYPDGTFRPGKNITRAEAMTLINRVLERDVEQEHMLSDMVKWIDNDPDAWYYEAVQEATNSHTYTRLNKKVPGQSFNYEDWIKILKNPDWAALEKTWSKN